MFSRSIHRSLPLFFSRDKPQSAPTNPTPSHVRTCQLLSEAGKVRVWLENTNLGVFLDATVDQIQNNCRHREPVMMRLVGIIGWSDRALSFGVLSSDFMKEKPRR